MIFKVFYQPNKEQTPHRENTKAIYVEAESIGKARQLVTDNTPYSIEYIQELSPAHLEYEQGHNLDYKVETF